MGGGQVGASFVMFANKAMRSDPDRHPADPLLPGGLRDHEGDGRRILRNRVRGRRRGLQLSTGKALPSDLKWRAGTTSPGSPLLSLRSPRGPPTAPVPGRSPASSSSGSGPCARPSRPARRRRPRRRDPRRPRPRRGGQARPGRERARVLLHHPHFDGHASVLILLERIPEADLEEAIVEAWLCRAPAKLADTYLRSVSRRCRRRASARASGRRSVRALRGRSAVCRPPGRSASGGASGRRRRR